MKFWESVIFIDAIRKGLTEEEAKSKFPSLKGRVKRGLRSIGISHRIIEMEYPERLLAKDMELAINNPRGFDNAVLSAAEELCSRN